MELSLSRVLEFAGGVFGVLAWRDRRLWTLEREWAHNRSHVSCVPCGRYELVPFSGVKYPATFALVGDTVSAFESHLPRHACVIHAASYSSDLAGCVAIGQSVSAYGRLNHSQDATGELLTELRSATSSIFLTIGNGRG